MRSAQVHHCIYCCHVFDLCVHDCTQCNFPLQILQLIMKSTDYFGMVTPCAGVSTAARSHVYIYIYIYMCVCVYIYDRRLHGNADIEPVFGRHRLGRIILKRMSKIGRSEGYSSPTLLFHRFILL